MRTSRRDPAKNAPGQPGRDTSTSSSAPGRSLKVGVKPFTKRKATAQRDNLQDSWDALKEKEEVKRQRRSVAKDTPRRTSARRATARSKKVKEVDQPSPSAEETDIPSLKDNNCEKGDSEVTGKPENQGSQAIRQQDEEAPETGGGAVPETTDMKLGIRDYKTISPGPPQTAKHIEWRRRLGQNPAFLKAVERALADRRKELDTCNQELEKNPSDAEIKEKAAQLQHTVWLFEDTIHWVREGTYHQR